MPNTAADPAVTPVAVGILENARHQVLVTRRADDKHQGGKWEFPGGKIHAGEGMPDALARELQEELGIHLHSARPLRRVHHAYPDKTVLLDVWRVDDYTGEPHGREGQPLRWVSLAELETLELPEADRPIVQALKLPPLYLISNAARCGATEFLDRLERALRAGARLLQLREPDLSEPDYRALARATIDLARRYGARILLNAPPALVTECGADGVHLNSRRLMEAKTRPLPASRLVAASCHNEAELRQAARVGADFVVLSPVRTTASHPRATVLGWGEFARLRQGSDVPVYALGGLRPGDLPQARSCGAHGIAMISGVWQAASIEAAVAEALG
jgi:8-oxo-dGTP diphosphatase